jgi:hypothetical protein
MLRRLLTLAVLTALVVLAINTIPDVRRYLKIRSM